MNLQRFVSLARDSWAEHNPALFKQLQASGELQQALNDAAKRTHEEMSELETAGFSHQEAWEMTREKYLLLPPEEMGDEVESKGVALYREALVLQSKLLRGDDLESE